MLSYPISEAEELLESKLSTAKTSLSNCEEDLDFLREQITVYAAAFDALHRYRLMTTSRLWRSRRPEFTIGRWCKSEKTGQGKIRIMSRQHEGGIQMIEQKRQEFASKLIIAPQNSAQENKSNISQTLFTWLQGLVNNSLLGPKGLRSLDERTPRPTLVSVSTTYLCSLKAAPLRLLHKSFSNQLRLAAECQAASCDFFGEASPPFTTGVLHEQSR